MKKTEERKSVLIRGCNIKDAEEAVRLLKETDVDFYEMFSNEPESTFIHTHSAYSYRGMKEIMMFAAMNKKENNEKLV